MAWACADSSFNTDYKKFNLDKTLSDAKVQHLLITHFIQTQKYRTHHLAISSTSSFLPSYLPISSSECSFSPLELYPTKITIPLLPSDCSSVLLEQPQLSRISTSPPPSTVFPQIIVLLFDSYSLLPLLPHYSSRSISQERRMISKKLSRKKLFMEEPQGGTAGF